METNKFATMLHRNTSKLTMILVYTLLEWILIILLLLNSLFSYLIIKFASFFGLKTPCLWCSRIDHVLDSGKDKHCYRDLLCQNHSMEISRLGYCLNHGRLAEACDMCEDCSFSQPRPENRIAFGISIDGRLKMDNSDQDLKCSCCNLSLNSGFYSKILWNHGLFNYNGKEKEAYDDGESSDSSSKLESPIEQIKVPERFLCSSDSEEEIRNRDDGIGEKANWSSQCEESRVVLVSSETVAETKGNSNFEGNHVLESSEASNVFIRDCFEDLSCEILPIRSVMDDDRLVSLELIDLLTAKTEIRVNNRELDTMVLSENDFNGDQGEGILDFVLEFQKDGESGVQLETFSEEISRMDDVTKLEKIENGDVIVLGDEDTSVLPAEEGNRNEIGETQDQVGLSLTKPEKSAYRDLIVFADEHSSVLPAEEAHGNEIGETEAVLSHAKFEKIEDGDLIVIEDEDSSVLPAEEVDGDEIGETQIVLSQAKLEKIEDGDLIVMEEEDSSVLPAEEADGDEIGETQVVLSQGKLEKIEDGDLIVIEEEDSSVLAAEEADGDEIGETQVVLSQAKLEKIEDRDLIEIEDEDSSVLPAEEADGNEIGETQVILSQEKFEKIENSDLIVIEDEDSSVLQAAEVDGNEIGETQDQVDLSQTKLEKIENRDFIVFEDEDSSILPAEEADGDEIGETQDQVLSQATSTMPRDGEIIEAETVEYCSEVKLEEAKGSKSEERDCSLVSQTLSETGSPERIEQNMSNHLSISTEHNEGDEEKVPETPTSMEGIHNLHKRLLFERKESGPESLDGSAISELEGGDGASIERLKAALKAERKSLSALYSELEEERSASAVAANQTMAMITRLQEEKAAMQMEALQYQRMMEEQSEYDQEALQLLNELMVKREKEKQELEKELELYRKKVLLYEAKEKRLRKRKSNEHEMGQIMKNGVSSASSSAGDSDELSIDLNEGDDHFYGVQENGQHTPVDGVLSLGKGHEPVKALSTLDESLADFEEERLSILEQLKVLEEKLFTLGDEETFEHVNGGGFYDHEGIEITTGISSNGKHQIERRNLGSKPKMLLPLFDAMSGETEAELDQEEEEEEEEEEHAPKFKSENKRFSVEEEVDHVYERLQALEADREFIKHCISSLKKGDKGLDLLQEILQHLRDLKSVELRARNMGD